MLLSMKQEDMTGTETGGGGARPTVYKHSILTHTNVSVDKNRSVHTHTHTQSKKYSVYINADSFTKKIHKCSQTKHRAQSDSTIHVQNEQSQRHDDEMRIIYQHCVFQQA